MNRWALLLSVAAFAAAGCGGGNGGGGPIGGGTLSSVNPAIFDKPGRLEITFDTGQGRAPGSQAAVLRRLFVNDIIGLVETQLDPERKLLLDGYTFQSVALNPSMGGFSLPVLSRLFQSFPLEILAFEVEQLSGEIVRYQDPDNAPLFFQNFPLYARVFPGRTTIVQLFLDDAMMFFDETTGQVIFDQGLFETVNFDPIDQRLNGFLADFIAFDISNVPNKPQLTSGADATMVYFSGDALAISEAPVLGGAPMEVLTPLSPPIEALVSPPVSFPIVAPGTYTHRQVDPRDLPGIARITALQGIWRPAFDPNPSKSVILNAGTFECLLIPNSNDNEKQEIIFVERDEDGAIIEMYFGEADFAAGRFAAWPIENIDDGDSVNEIGGTLTGIVFRSDNPGGPASVTTRYVRSGVFTFDSGDVPPSWPLSGRFLVVRR